MIPGGPVVAEFELSFQARAERWGHLFGRTVRDLRKALSANPPGGARLPLETLFIPISDLQFQTQEELVRVCLAICQEIKGFSTAHSLTQDIWVVYSPVPLAGGRTETEMSTGKKKIEELKQRMLTLVMKQGVGVNLRGHPPSPQRGTSPSVRQGLFFGAICVDRVVLKRKDVARARGEHILSLPIKMDPIGA